MPRMGPTRPSACPPCSPHPKDLVYSSSKTRGPYQTYEALPRVPLLHPAVHIVAFGSIAHPRILLRGARHRSFADSTCAVAIATKNPYCEAEQSVAHFVGRRGWTSYRQGGPATGSDPRGGEGGTYRRNYRLKTQLRGYRRKQMLRPC